MGGLRDHGAELFEKGYPIIPIKPNSKTPSGKGWQRIKCNSEMLKKWLEENEEYGVGVLTATTPCIDIDVPDAAAVDAVIKHAQELWGVLPYRVGREPRAAIYFRASTPFGKRASPVYRIKGKETAQIEILGQGQQSVLYGVHPKTHKSYQWPAGELPPYGELPELTEAKADEFIAWFENYAGDKGWEKTGNEHSGNASNDPLANAKPPVGDEAAIIEALGNIDADAYEAWRTVGMALHHEYSGGAKGFDIWNEWSAKSDKYNAEVMQSKWDSFSEELTKRGIVTAATILMLGQQAKGESNLEEFLRRYVYVERGDLVADLDKAPSAKPIPHKNWVKAIADKMSTVPNPNNPERIKLMPTSSVWLAHPDKHVVTDLDYMPAEDRIFTNALGEKMLNTFYTPVFEEPKDKTPPALLLGHIRYLIPDDVDAEWFLDWLALTLQRPAERSRVAPFHISPKQGTGRGWVVALLNKLLGTWNIANPELEDFINSPFNEFLSGKLVCVIEETKEPKGRYELADKIKSKIEAPQLTINRKYGGKGKENIFANVLMFSNHPDALVIKPEDRRFYVIDGAEEPRDNAYYEKLYAALDDKDWLARVDWWLRHRDISNADFNRCRKNEARAKLIATTMSDTEQAFREFIKAPPYKAMTYQNIVKACAEILGEGGEDMPNINDGMLIKLLKNSSARTQVLKHKGETLRPWVFQRGLDNKQIREALNGQA